MSDSDWWFLDLALVIAATGLVTFVLIAPVTGPLRIVAGVPLLLFLPGYALVSVLYPDAPTERYPPFDDEKTGLQTPLLNDGGLEGVERFVLSVVLSIAIVPAVALAASISPMGITVLPILIGLGLVTAVLTVVAIVRRARCPPEKRFAPSARSSSVLFSPSDNPFGETNVKLFNAIILLSLLVLVASAGFALANSPAEGDGYTEFYLESDEVDPDAETMYDDTLSAGESHELTAHIANEEGAETEYTTVAALQQVSYGEEDVEVHEQEELERAATTVPDGETEAQTLEVSPTTTGDDLRLVVLLYEGDAPADPSEDDAYRTIDMPVVVE